MSRVSHSFVRTLYAAPILRKSYNSFRFVAMSEVSGAPPKETGGAFQNKKRSFQNGKPNNKRQRKQKEKPIKEGGHEEVLLADVKNLLAARKSQAEDSNVKLESSESDEQPKDAAALPAKFEEIEVEVLELSSTGDGLAVMPNSDQIYVVPFSAPGDKLKVKVITHFEQHNYSLTDFVSVVEHSSLRDDSRISCKYFAKCSGCQFQMLDYATQLEHKKKIVENAYKNFSQLPPELVPVIQDTIGSPLQYGYRTKLTPHFDGPPGSGHHRGKGPVKPFEKVPEIGFMQKGMRRTLDIEDCPIGTDAVRMGMKRERLRVAEELSKYKRGATILLRESTQRIPKDSSDVPTETPDNTIRVENEKSVDLKTCITDSNATSTEYINDYIFTNPAGSFFQNNNSILPVFTDYICSHILPRTNPSQIKYLIDAYSGSGLFTITLSSLFTSSTGIDIAGASIEYARKNAALNGMSKERANFIAADAPELFKSVKYPKDETVVVLDPPRKGCDESFLSQLLDYAPRRVVYVSCNVHTQARDVGTLVQGKGGVRYEVESLRGFDFFPQTGHVEGVAVLSRFDEATEEPVTKAEEPVIKAEEQDEPVIKAEEPVIKAEEPVIKSEDPMIKAEEPAVKVED